MAISSTYEENEGAKMETGLSLVSIVSISQISAIIITISKTIFKRFKQVWMSSLTTFGFEV